MMREIGLHQTHSPFCNHVVVPYMTIVHMQSHSKCNQYATKYGNVIQVCTGTVFKESSLVSRRKHGDFSLKEGGSNDNRFIVPQT